MIDYQILIPAFNASDTLPQLLREINQLDYKPTEILVVDDGSCDDTASIAQQMNVKTLRLKANKVKGYALKKGWQHLINDPETDYILFIDADLQHPVTSIPKFLDHAYRHKCKFIIGKRDIAINKMPIHRILSNKITSFIISILTGQAIEDSQCGFRLIHKEVLKKIQLFENGFQLESEIILRAAEIPVQINFISIPTLYNGEKSNIGNFQDTFKFIKLVLKEIIRKAPCILKNRD